MWLIWRIIQRKTNRQLPLLPLECSNDLLSGNSQWNQQESALCSCVAHLRCNFQPIHFSHWITPNVVHALLLKTHCNQNAWYWYIMQIFAAVNPPSSGAIISGKTYPRLWGADMFILNLSIQVLHQPTTNQQQLYVPRSLFGKLYVH